MVIRKDKGQSAAAELLRRAEERLKERNASDSPEIADETLTLGKLHSSHLKIFHELQVHRVELEMQNAELRHARDELETVVEKYTDLYDLAPVGYITLDRSGNIKTANLTVSALLGIERSRLIGRRFEQFIPAEPRSYFSAFLGEVFAAQAKKTCEMELLTEGKSPLFAQIEAMVHGPEQECRVALIDITERRRVEDALIMKQRELEELNRSLEARIAQAVDETRQKDRMLIIQGRMAAMGEMINNIAHQWRQPLNALGLVVQQVPFFYDSTEFGREYLEENCAQAMRLIQHMSKTIDDFREFFKPDKKREYFDVNLTINHTLSLIKESFKEQKITIVLKTEGDPAVNGYPNEYAHALLNILLNARDALVSQNVEKARVSIHSFMEGDTSVVTITDNADGIAVEIIDRLFDPYFTTKEPDQGTGIGLFMSRTIIEKNMGGRLSVRNTGSGAEFRIAV